MRQAIFLILALSGTVAVAQDDAADARLRASIAGAPRLPFERVEITLDPRLEIDEVSAVTADRQGHLYIFQRSKAADPVIVTDAKGKVLRSFGAGLFNRPHGIRIDRDGNVWTVDSNTSLVYKHSPAGEKLLEIAVGDLWPDPPSDSCAAADVAFASNGHVYVADGYCNSRVVEYDAAGNKVREWGAPGDGPGEFDLLHSIAVGPDGNVYVADRENGRLQWFTQAGEYLGQWEYGGRVLSVVFSLEGELYISAEPKGAPPQQEAALLHIDRRDGSVLGKLEAFGHELSVGHDGSLLPASLGAQIIVYRPR